MKHSRKRFDLDIRLGFEFEELLCTLSKSTRSRNLCARSQFFVRALSITCSAHKRPSYMITS